MGYYLSAFIGKPEVLKIIAETYPVSKIVDLTQGLSLVPFTEDLFDQINNFETSKNIQSFEYLTTNIEDKISKLTNDRQIAYVEANYFGGEGGQVAIIWADGQRITQLNYGQDVINAVLRQFGVVAEKGRDEFATLGFGRHRDTADWMERRYRPHPGVLSGGSSPGRRQVIARKLNPYGGNSLPKLP